MVTKICGFGMITANTSYDFKKGIGKVTKVVKIKLKKVPKYKLEPKDQDKEITAIKFKNNTYDPLDNPEEKEEKKQSIEDAIDEILKSREVLGT